MRTKRITLVVLALLTISMAAPAVEKPRATADEVTLDVLLNAIRANRKAVVATSLTLNDTEATAFWPIYDRYEQEMNGLSNRLAAVLQDYATSFKSLSNEKAMTLVDEYLTIEAERIKIRRTYVEELGKVVPGRTVARFFQIENKMDAVIRYDLAAAIPVVEEAGGAADR